VDGTRCRNDDDEDQHSAVLWLSLRKVEVKELELRERETEKHSLRECPQDRHCGSAHETATAGVPTRPRPLPQEEEHSDSAQRPDQSTL
jgi:hypothetical protein